MNNDRQQYVQERENSFFRAQLSPIPENMDSGNRKPGIRDDDDVSSNSLAEPLHDENHGDHPLQVDDGSGAAFQDDQHPATTIQDDSSDKRAGHLWSPQHGNDKSSTSTTLKSSPSLASADAEHPKQCHSNITGGIEATDQEGRVDTDSPIGHDRLRQGNQQMSTAPSRQPETPDEISVAAHTTADANASAQPTCAPTTHHGLAIPTTSLEYIPMVMGEDCRQHPYFAHLQDIPSSAILQGADNAAIWSAPQQHVQLPAQQPMGTMWVRTHTGELIQVSPVQQPAHYPSPATVQCWPVEPPSTEHNRVDNRQSATLESQRRDDYLTSEGIDPCDPSLSADSETTDDDQHSLSVQQRAKAAVSNKQLIRMHLMDDPVDSSKENPVETMCTLWPISTLYEAATKRTKISTIHDLLSNYVHHSPKQIAQLTQDIKRKAGPDLSLAIRSAVSRMFMVRTDYPVEVIQLAIVLHVTSIKDRRMTAKLDMVKQLAHESMWTPLEDLTHLWTEVMRMHESPMQRQIQAQIQGGDIWTSPGVTTFSPHHPDFTENWAQFYASFLHVLCYQPDMVQQKHFELARATFDDPSWRQLPQQQVREFNAHFKSQATILRNAALQDKLDVEDSMPKRLHMVKSYISRLQKTTRTACLWSLKRKTYLHDLDDLDLEYARGSLENLHLEDLMLLASVAWREEEDEDPVPAERRTLSRKPTQEHYKERTQRNAKDKYNATDTRTRWREQRSKVRAAATSAERTDTIFIDISDMQRRSKGRINTTKQYIQIDEGKENPYWLSPSYEFGCTDCDNCHQQHWHDRPCDSSLRPNTPMPTSKRHSAVSKKMVEQMNAKTYNKLIIRYQGGKDGKPLPRPDRPVTSDTKRQGKDRAATSAATRAKTNSSSAKPAVRSKPAKASPQPDDREENDHCSEDESITSDSSGDCYASYVTRATLSITDDEIYDMAATMETIIPLARNLMRAALRMLSSVYTKHTIQSTLRQSVMQWFAMSTTDNMPTQAQPHRVPLHITETCNSDGNRLVQTTDTTMSLQHDDVQCLGAAARKLPLQPSTAGFGYRLW